MFLRPLWCLFWWSLSENGLEKTEMKMFIKPCNEIFFDKIVLMFWKCCGRTHASNPSPLFIFWRTELIAHWNAFWCVFYEYPPSPPKKKYLIPITHTHGKQRVIEKDILRLNWPSSMTYWPTWLSTSLTSLARRASAAVVAHGYASVGHIATI